MMKTLDIDLGTDNSLPCVDNIFIILVLGL